MADEVRLAGAVAAALALGSILTPLAIAVAHRLTFFDRPAGYKQHGAPTPYLGGAAVIAAVLLTAIVFGGAAGTYAPIALGAIGLFGVGTIDDRVGLGPGLRLFAATLAALTLSANGLGWNFFVSEAANLGLTLFWVVGLVNAFNLMDNLDGACSSVAATSAAGIAVISALEGAYPLAAFAAALSAGCIAFLRFNLAGPARIFLGDGGSMPIGFLLAALVMAGPAAVRDDWAPLVSAAMFVGLVIFDTSLVVLSRLRRGAPVLRGGRDHLTHRLLLAVGSERHVAVVLITVQGGLCALGVVAAQSQNPTVALSLGVGCMALGAVALGALEVAYIRLEASVAEAVAGSVAEPSASAEVLVAVTPSAHKSR